MFKISCLCYQYCGDGYNFVWMRRYAFQGFPPPSIIQFFFSFFVFFHFSGPTPQTSEQFDGCTRINKHHIYTGRFSSAAGIFVFPPPLQVASNRTHNGYRRILSKVFITIIIAITFSNIKKNCKKTLEFAWPCVQGSHDSHAFEGSHCCQSSAIGFPY